ncbi:hypothetical protein PR202_ga29423 [Eleusine coracana subsp. coracana]|uniref:Peptidase S8/S53 domain-containing protein n=1 Tax=Eleusine coracana subsp. coracana TaxID=191504 RepID=A0AAV5DMA2_ELECO|nr:hypothetical protein PR202_ga29423 [Eleusine coracana subsp. coracana]
MSYAASSAYPLASLKFTCETVIGENRAPMVVKFSSRGPNPVVPELLKPDVVAPGQNILAAWKGDYVMQSGTSMACPHVAGVAALIKKKHPDWTPAMIRSALITTADTLDNTDRDILDTAVTAGGRGGTAATPFDTGAGHVRPQLAMDPGLVYDAGARDYVDFLCALNYTVQQLQRFAPDLANCTRTLPGGPAGLNYPSFVVVFGNGTDVRTLTRTVTAVSEKAETYTVSYALSTIGALDNHHSPRLVEDVPVLVATHHAIEFDPIVRLLDMLRHRPPAEPLNVWVADVYRGCCGRCRDEPSKSSGTTEPRPSQVSEKAKTYKVATPEQVKVIVTRTMLEFKKHME